MKSTIMKLGTALIVAFALPCAMQAAINPNDPVLLRYKAEFERLGWSDEVQPETVPAPIFIKAIANNIKKSVSEVIEHIIDFINPKNNTETFTQYVTKVGDLTAVIHSHTIKPLAEAIRIYPQGAERHIVMTTQDIMADFFTRFKKIHAIMNAHLYSGAAQNALRLANQLQPELEAITATSKINDLLKNLIMLEGLLTEQGLTDVAQDIHDLREILSKVKSGLGNTQKAIKLELFAKIIRRLNKL